jgi:hypothetical protein
LASAPSRSIADVALGDAHDRASRIGHDDAVAHRRHRRQPANLVLVRERAALDHRGEPIEDRQVRALQFTRMRP